MKTTALALGISLALASTGLAYESDDFGFPIRPTATQNNCPPGSTSRAPQYSVFRRGLIVSTPTVSSQARSVATTTRVTTPVRSTRSAALPASFRTIFRR